MNRTRRKKILILYSTILLINPMLHGVMTEVYNLRISETTKRSPFEHDVEGPWIIHATQVNGFRKKYSGITHSYNAGMGTLSYTMPTYYYRVDVAGAQVRSDDHGIHFSRNQMDDLLVSTGISHAIGNTVKLTATGMLGIPLHPDTSLLHVQFGYGHVGLGVQGDGSFIFSENRKHSLRPAVRYIRFLKRDVCAENDYGELESFHYTFGNLIDLFLSYHYHTRKQRFEIGCDQIFLCGSSIFPHLDEVTKKTNYIRTDFYTSYKHRFRIHSHQSAITVALSCGFDARPHEFGFKRLVVFWAAWEINF